MSICVTCCSYTAKPIGDNEVFCEHALYIERTRPLNCIDSRCNRGLIGINLIFCWKELDLMHSIDYNNQDQRALELD